MLLDGEIPELDADLVAALPHLQRNNLTGHFTKTVEDSALFLQVTVGNDPLDATTVNPKHKTENYLEGINDGVKGLKLGIPKEYVNGLSPEIAKRFEETKKKFEELGIKCPIWEHQAAMTV